METTSILYVVIALIIAIFIGIIYYVSQKKKTEVVREVSAPQVIIKTVEACKLGYKLIGTDCIFDVCPPVSTGSKPYYNDIINKECKLYTDDVWNAYKANVVNNPCKIYTLNPNANSYSSANKNDNSDCPLQDNCSTSAKCFSGVCQQTRLVCGNGFTCRNGTCEFTSEGKCPEGTYFVKGTKTDQSDYECKGCTGLTSVNRQSCTSPWNPSSDGTDNLTSNGCDINKYYAKSLGNSSYQCTLRTNVDNKVTESLGCLQKNTYQITSDTTTTNINEGLKCPNIDIKYNQDKCIITNDSKCKNGGCNIIRKDNSYYNGTNCITCSSTNVEVVNMQNNGCFSCKIPTFDTDLFNKCTNRYTQEEILAAMGF